MPSDDRTKKRIEELERRVRTRGGDRELLLQLVQLYEENRQYDAVAALLESRVTSGEGDWDLLRGCCEAHRKSGKGEQGLALLDAHGSEFRETAAYWSQRGHLHESMGAYDEARADHDRALAIEPERAEYRYRLGVTLMRMDHAQEAILCFEQCIRIDPSMTKAQINIGYIHDRSDEPQKAILAFQRAIEMDPRSVESHCNLGAAYADLGRKREAIEEFRRAIELDPDYAMAHFNLGVIFLDDRPADAEVCLRRALSLEPGNWEIQFTLGVLYFKKGIYETAIRYLLECRERSPDDPRVLKYLGMSYNKSDRSDEAVEILSRLCDLEPQNAEAHFNLGIALDKKGMFERAKVAYREADRLMHRG